MAYLISGKLFTFLPYLIEVSPGVIKVLQLARYHFGQGRTTVNEGCLRHRERWSGHVSSPRCSLIRVRWSAHVSLLRQRWQMNWRASLLVQSWRWCGCSKEWSSEVALFQKGWSLRLMWRGRWFLRRKRWMTQVSLFGNRGDCLGLRGRALQASCQCPSRCLCLHQKRRSGHVAFFGKCFRPK